VEYFDDAGRLVAACNHTPNPHGNLGVGLGCVGCSLANTIRDRKSEAAAETQLAAIQLTR